MKMSMNTHEKLVQPDFKGNTVFERKPPVSSGERTYSTFLASKKTTTVATGIDISPDQINSTLFPFQKILVQWALHTTGTRVLANGHPATVTRDCEPHSIVYARIDGSSEERPFLPECVSLIKQQEQQAVSLRDAWRAK